MSGNGWKCQMPNSSFWWVKIVLNTKKNSQTYSRSPVFYWVKWYSRWYVQMIMIWQLSGTNLDSDDSFNWIATKNRSGKGESRSTASPIRWCCYLRGTAISGRSCRRRISPNSSGSSNLISLISEPWQQWCGSTGSLATAASSKDARWSHASESCRPDSFRRFTRRWCRYLYAVLKYFNLPVTGCQIAVTGLDKDNTDEKERVWIVMA